MSPEFPSVLAPDFDEIHKKSSKAKKEKKKKDNKESKREWFDSMTNLRKERKILGAKNIFSVEEVMSHFTYNM